MSDPQPNPSAGGVTDGRVTWKKKIIDATLDTWVWPIDRDVRGSTGGPGWTVSVISEYLELEVPLMCAVNTGETH